LRVGLAVFAYSKAAFSFARLFGPSSGPLATQSFARGYRIMAIGYVTAGIVLGLGGLWYGGFAGLLGAYAAFSLAWVWFWISRRLATANGDGRKPGQQA
jgi:hypothetical protein